MKSTLALVVLSLASLWPTASWSASSTTCNNGDSVIFDVSVGCGTPQRSVTTIGSLPSCTSALRGKMYIVTDALLPTALANVAAGGAVVIGVMCNGVNWVVQ
jgi:hypothetical protein